MAHEKCRPNCSDWTPLAPELDLAEAGPENLETWYWCFRCGRLRLGDEESAMYFTPGPHQEAVIKEDEQKT